MHLTQNLLAKIIRSLRLLLILSTLGSPAAGLAAEPYNWQLVTKDAGWQARDSQGELVFNDQLWVFGGWFDSYSAPPRDVWSSPDGRTWKQVTQQAPWLHSDLSMSLTFDDRMWFMGGWYNGRLEGHSASNAVWSSTNGAQWTQLNSDVIWKECHEHSAYVFKDQIFVAGGHAKPLSNEVWSLELPKDWGK